jgi:hypothetical protein
MGLRDFQIVSDAREGVRSGVRYSARKETATVPAWLGVLWPDVDHTDLVVPAIVGVAEAEGQVKHSVRRQVALSKQAHSFR